MNARTQKHRMLRWMGRFIATLLLALFATFSPAQAAVESVAPLSGGIIAWSLNGWIWTGITFPSADAVCRSVIQDHHMIGNGWLWDSAFNYSYLGTVPIRKGYGTLGSMDCMYVHTPDGVVIPAGLAGSALPIHNAVCPIPIPIINPTVPYSYNAATNMCERTLSETYKLTLTPETATIEPWHKKFDQNHTTANLPFKAVVMNQNGQVKANVSVSIASDVTPDSGGHVHTYGRPKGKLVADTPSSTLGGTATITGITDSTGTFSFTFGAEEASGEHKLTATCSGCQAPANAAVNVLIPGLMLLDADPLGYELRGSTDSHPGNHHFSGAAIVKIINLAHAYKKEFNQFLIINDSSLSRGGVLDLGQDWTYKPNGHQGHRKGVVVDINNYRNGPSQKFEELAARFRIEAVWEGSGVTPTPHYHLWLLGRNE